MEAVRGGGTMTTQDGSMKYSYKLSYSVNM